MISKRRRYIRGLIMGFIVFLLIYTRVLNIIKSPDEELCLSISENSSYYEKMKIKILLTRGADPGKICDSGISPIQYAVISENIWLVREFLPLISLELKSKLFLLIKKHSNNEELLQILDGATHKIN